MKTSLSSTLLALSLVFAGAVPAFGATGDGTPSADGPQPGFVPGEVLVTFRDGFLPKEVRGPLASAWGLQEVSFAPATALFRFRITDGRDVDAKLSFLESRPEVASVTKNWLGQLFFTPNDPYWSRQWGMSKVKMPTAWDRLIAAGRPGGSTRYIAIADTGVDLDHPDLGVIYGWNFVTGRSDRGDDCNDPQGAWHGHGSLVAGTAAAFTNNSRGIAGANYAAPILSAKMTDLCTPVLSAAVEAIEYSVDNGASTITASWGWYFLTDTQLAPLKNAVQYAYNNNVLVVAASGNDSWNNFNNIAPARWFTVVTVGGTTSTDSRAPFANYGAPGLDVSAPAVDIFSTNSIGGYEWASGTSFSVPFVAGTIGLIKGKYPSWTSSQIKNRLGSTADKVGGYNYSWSTICGGQSAELGCGRLDAADAVK